MEKLVKQIIRRIPTPNFLNWPNNWGLKLISLIFALLLWYFVVGEDKVDTTVYIPVEIVNLPREMVIANQFKKQLEATVSGPRGLISGINRQRISRTINLAKATPGTIVIRNEPETIQFPRGVTVSRIQPTHITLLIDELVEKELPVQARTTGSPANGHELGGVVLEPSIIKVSGPKAVLGREKLLIAKPIDISGLKASKTFQVPLELRPALLELMGETVVTANVVIKEKTMEKTISDITVHLVGTDTERKVTFEPHTISVRALLPLSSKGNQAEFIEASISTDGLPIGVHRLPVKITAPEQIKIIEAVPPSVTVRIGRIPGK
ncbi:CdaR family protein [Thiovibrio frasassiensis]|jgi:YbbR domain-containing protein|uniref:CdaR family protein n=1 Tax=Thiovibrio frasassiensis TaxID=2984131 RepID=A0A9X4MGW5_9BACT|nr:CdaR family protein [Thiovibrio frasassiensis]MDG4474604.1 CdaR family protein [Thiovibrio frasassiensis]